MKAEKNITNNNFIKNKKRNKTYTFKDATGEFILTIKKDFLKICPNPHLFSAEFLYYDFKISKYLHNKKGPAVIRILDEYDDTNYWWDRSFRWKNKRIQFWIDGVYLNFSSNEYPIKE